MKKSLCVLSALVILAGCVQDRDLYNVSEENRKDFELFDKITVESSLPAGTKCMLFTTYPYEDGALVVEPSMTAYAPFNKEVRVPKNVDKLYVYANGILNEYNHGNIKVEGTAATKSAPLTRAETLVPGEITNMPLSDAFITAIYDFYPEGQKNLSAADMKISTDLVAPEGVKEVINHPGGGQETVNYGNTKVWITYVGNGGAYFAGDLWFYTYKVDGNKKPISTLEEIEATMTPVFNRAFPSNVNPKKEPVIDRSGKRVYLGEFEPGTRIGFKYYGNAHSTGTTPYPKYSTPYYNNLAYPRRGDLNLITCGVIRSWDYEGKTYATLGMENRLPTEGSACDSDYNDMICLIEANPIVIENKLDPPTPVEENVKWQGYWLFEDQYPKEGDYDFNDLVVKYAITEYPMEAVIDLQFMARGAGYNNKLGVNDKIYFEGLAGYVNVYENEEKGEQPIHQIRLAVASKYIPLMNNGVISFDLNTFNKYTLDFPNVLEIPSINGSKFLWCLEKTRIDAAYPRYKAWVDSNCTTNTDWYTDTPVAGTVWDK